jgi:uncharacterized protein
MQEMKTYSAFAGDKLVASGDLKAMLSAAKVHLDGAGDLHGLLIFEDQTGRQVDFDFRGTLEQVLDRAAPDRAGPGRPKLGVVSREVSLLPSHWEWLEEQPNGISAALRRLVDEAKKRDPAEQHARRARDAISRFMSAIAGNRPNFEDATRALYAKDHDRVEQLIRKWPKDIRNHILRLLDETKVDAAAKRK